MTGLSDSYISLVFRSKVANPQFDKVCKMAHALNTSLDDLYIMSLNYPDVVTSKKARPQ